MIRRPPRSTRVRSSAASDVYKRQLDDLRRADVLKKVENGGFLALFLKRLVRLLCRHGVLECGVRPTDDGGDIRAGGILDIVLRQHREAERAELELDPHRL